MKDKKIRIEFIMAAETHDQRYYCGKCFYGKDKARLEEYPKPSGYKCYIGSRGYFMALEYINENEMKPLEAV